MPKRDDDEITGEIIAAFAANPRTHAVEMRVKVKDGVAHLQGVVETLEESRLAEETALGIRGILRVINDLTVSTDKDVSDAEIEEQARQALDAADLTFIGVSVERGEACLMGVAESEAVEKRAIDEVSPVSGVRAVCSAIRISEPEPWADDVALADDVAQVLSEDPRLEFLDLDVLCEDGDVILTGYILNEDQFESATNVAESVPGVRSVENRMILQELPWAA